MQGIPFKDEGHRMTKHLRTLVEKRMELGNTIKAVSRDLDLHPTIIKEIDKKRLQERFRTKKPGSYSTHIAIDEILLHKGHRYATVALNLQRCHVPGSDADRPNDLRQIRCDHAQECQVDGNQPERIAGEAPAWYPVCPKIPRISLDMAWRPAHLYPLYA